MKNFVGATNYLEIYFNIVLFSLIFGAFGIMQPKKKKWYVIVLFGYLAFLTAFRMSYVGSDTPGYLASFRNIARYSSPFDYIKREGMEPGFVVFSWLVSRINNDPQTLLIVSSLIIYISTGKFVYKYIKNPGLFCCLFVGIMQFDFFMSAMRQSLSIAIILFFFDFVVKKKHFKFAIVCLLASTFHYSSILLFLLYPFVSTAKENNTSAAGKFWGVICIIGISLFFNKSMNIIIAIFPKYSSYLAAETFDGVPRLALILKISVYGLLFIIPKLLEKEELYDNRFDALSEKLSYINICTLLVSMNAVALARFSNTFSMFATMYYVNQTISLKKEDYILLTIMTLLMFGLYGFIIVLLKTPEWTATFPIKLIF